MLSPSNKINPDILAAWVKGWALARQVSTPVAEGDGYKIHVGWPDQWVRYVFPTLSGSYLHIANTVTEPNIYLKVCAPPDDVRKLLPARWVIQPVGYFMVCGQPMINDGVVLHGGYTLEVFKDRPVPVVQIVTGNGELAAIGRVVFADDYAIYDRIETRPAHRRKGLASMVMYALQEMASGKGITKGLLVATAEGRMLYEKLGWQLCSLYTTAVIHPDSFDSEDGLEALNRLPY